jgi:hypothetical protein
MKIGQDGGRGCGEWMLKGKTGFCNGCMWTGRSKTQRDAEAVSSLVLLVCRVCMHEETSLQECIAAGKWKIFEARRKKLEGDRVESFDEKGIKVYETLERNHKTRIVC